jgi:hypothetical protein
MSEMLAKIESLETIEVSEKRGELESEKTEKLSEVFGLVVAPAESGVDTESDFAFADNSVAAAFDLIVLPTGLVALPVVGNSVGAAAGSTVVLFG